MTIGRTCAQADQVLGILYPRLAQTRLLSQANCELHIERRLDAGSNRFAIALQRMAVSDEKDMRPRRLPAA